MSKGGIGARKYIVMGLAILLSTAVMVPLANGDVIVSSDLGLSYTVIPPPIIINETNNCYKGATFVLNTSYSNNSSVATLQVHLNFKLNGSTNFSTLLLNVLEVFNQANITGNMSVKIVKSAQAGANKTLNSTYTEALKVYISHNYQTSTDLGLLLQNNTAYHIPFYPFVDWNTPMYYIGMNYTEPPYLPSGTDLNSIQQFITFTFTVVS